MATDDHVDARLLRSLSNTAHVVEVMPAGVSQRVIDQKKSVHARILAAFPKSGQAQETFRSPTTNMMLALVAIDPST